MFVMCFLGTKISLDPFPVCLHGLSIPVQVVTGWSHSCPVLRYQGSNANAFGVQ